MNNIVLKNIEDFIDVLTQEDIEGIEYGIRSQILGSWEFTLDEDNFPGYGSFYEFEGEIMTVEEEEDSKIVWVWGFAQGEYESEYMEGTTTGQLWVLAKISLYASGTVKVHIEHDVIEFDDERWKEMDWEELDI